MLTHPTHFIELAKFANGSIHYFSIARVKFLKNLEDVNKMFGIETIAIFKIYPKHD